MYMSLWTSRGQASEHEVVKHSIQPHRHAWKWWEWMKHTHTYTHVSTKGNKVDFHLFPEQPSFLWKKNHAKKSSTLSFLTWTLVTQVACWWVSAISSGGVCGRIHRDTHERQETKGKHMPERRRLTGAASQRGPRERTFSRWWSRTPWTPGWWCRLLPPRRWWWLGSARLTQSWLTHTNKIHRDIQAVKTSSNYISLNYMQNGGEKKKKQPHNLAPYSQKHSNIMEIQSCIQVPPLLTEEMWTFPTNFVHSGIFRLVQSSELAC